MRIIENNNLNEQAHDEINFDLINVTEFYCNVGSEFYPEDRVNNNYGTNNYNEAFREIVSFSKDYNGLPHNINPYTNHRTFQSSYRVLVFDTRYQNDQIGPISKQLNFKFAIADLICHALVLTRKIFSVNCDGNKMVDIVSLKLIGKATSWIREPALTITPALTLALGCSSSSSSSSFTELFPR